MSKCCKKTHIVLEPSFNTYYMPVMQYNSACTTCGSLVGGTSSTKDIKFTNDEVTNTIRDWIFLMLKNKCPHLLLAERERRMKEEGFE